MKDLIYSFHNLVIKFKSVFKRLACMMRASAVAVRFIKSFKCFNDPKLGGIIEYESDMDFEVDVQDELYNLGFEYSRTRKNR